MKKRRMAILIAAVMMVLLTACGGGEEETTLTGMVVAVDGSTISLMEMDMTGMEMLSGDRTQMPEGMEGFQGFGGKASGSMDDVKAGTFVTLTINGKGEVTYVLVSSRSFSGGSRRPAN